MTAHTNNFEPSSHLLVLFRIFKRRCVTRKLFTVTTIKQVLGREIRSPEHISNMESMEEKALVEIDGSDGESFLCGICMEYKPMHSRSYCQGCPHYFCFNCILDHISYRVLGGGIPVRCPEPGCTIGELTYGFWYKHVMEDVHNAWTSAVLRDVSILRCGSCGQFSEGMTKEGMEDVEDDRLDALQRLAIARGWRPCPDCSIFIEWTGGCSIITCWCGCEFCFSCAEMFPPRGNIILKENEQMGKDDKLIQESTRNNEEDLNYYLTTLEAMRRQQFSFKAKFDALHNVGRTKESTPAGDNAATSSQGPDARSKGA